MNQSHKLPIDRQPRALSILAMAFLFVCLGMFIAPNLHAEDDRDTASRTDTLLVVLEIEVSGEEVRRYELLTTTLGNDAELNIGRTVPFEATRETPAAGAGPVVKTIQYQDVGIRFRAQVTRHDDGGYFIRGRIEDQQLVEGTAEGRPEIHKTSQSLQAILQPGTPLEVALGQGRIHRVTLRFPTGSGVGAGQR